MKTEKRIIKKDHKIKELRDFQEWHFADNKPPKAVSKPKSEGDDPCYVKGYN